MCMEFNGDKVYIAKKNIPVFKIFRRSNWGDIVTNYQGQSIENVLRLSAENFEKFGGYHCIAAGRKTTKDQIRGWRAKGDFLRKLYIPKGARYHEGTWEDRGLLGAERLISPVEARRSMKK